MPDSVSWNLQLDVVDGRGDDARALIGEMVDAPRSEAGTVGYEWFLSADGSTCHICETFVDSAAALQHLGNFGANFAERFMGCFAPTALSVYGNPSAEVRGVLDGLGAAYFGHAGGFRR